MRLTFGKGVAFGLLGTTAAMAGTGVGSIFNLGKTNTVNATSAVKGTASGPTLKLTNTGAGPALSLTVGTRAAPLTVSYPPVVKLPTLAQTNALMRRLLAIT